MPRECRRPHGRGAGIAAQTDDQRRAVFLEVPARSPVAGDVVGDEPHRQERISRHGLRGNRDVVEAGRPHRMALERLAAADERDLDAGQPLFQVSRDRQAGIQIGRPSRRRQTRCGAGKAWKASQVSR